ncbi:PP2C family protein-serine/threonine phosphatase [Nocardioides ferulae]|uniref:PP2C family protein-serine/threonine phosphatase n=1 Tax=Nocardioides ferulae TaxID=2340821 RepID=UPI000EB5CA44|nr:PP2C family protein-serine/threonine phosphatase [Nocardioides ferulae]
MTAADGAARAQSPATRHPWRTLRRGLAHETRVVGVLAALAAACTIAVALWPEGMPMVTLMVPLLLGSLVLGPRQLPWFVIFVMLMLMIALLAQTEITLRLVGTVATEFLMGFIVLLTSFRRSRLGVAGVMGESMLIDLRDRILGQGGVPEMPAGWHVDSALRSAGGTPFAGDFFVTSNPEPDRLEVVLVDVSGKGEQAGTRALLLSGAFGGLLGALPTDRFLPAANDYLLRQGWDEGFATAIHLSLHLDTGEFEIRTAGHPPAAHRTAGSGRWQVLESSGPVLGLIEDAEFAVVTGVLRPGDAVLLYTDGMVEQPQRDIELGIDRMLGEAESLLRGNFENAALRMVEAVGSRDDDRAMVVLHRR